MKKIYIITYLVFLTGYLSAQVVLPTEYYKFTDGSLEGENGTNSDFLSTALTLTRIPDKDGVANGAIEFDRAFDYSLGNPNLSTANGLSVSFWLKPSVSDAETRVVFAQRPSCSAVNMFAVRVKNGNVQFEMRSVSGGTSITTPYTLNTWQKFTFIIEESTNMLKAYTGDSLTSSIVFNEATRPDTFSGDILLTGSPCIGVNGTQRYLGGLDELKFYNTSLSNPTNDSEHYKFSNLSLEGENGTNEGVISTLLTATSDNNDNMDEAINLNVNQHSLGNPNLSTTNGLTISFWLKPSIAITDANTRVVFSQRGICGATEMMSVNSKSGEISLELRTPNSVTFLDVPYSVGTWQHFTFTLDRTNNPIIKGYKDGVFVKEIEALGNIPESFTGDNIYLTGSPCIGVDGTLRYEGGIDELRFYNRTLTVGEITRDFNANLVNGIFTSSKTIENILNIYPNPASSIINTEEGQLEIVDLAGNLVLSTESNGKVDVSALVTGVYIVTQNEKKTKLIIE